MNKTAIIQKLVNNEKVSDSLFRKIYKFLDMADSDDADGLVELFASEGSSRGKSKKLTGAERTRRWRGKRMCLPGMEGECDECDGDVTENPESVTFCDGCDALVTQGDGNVTENGKCDAPVTDRDAPVTESEKEKQEKKRSKRKETKEKDLLNFGISSQSAEAELSPEKSAQGTKRQKLLPEQAEYWRCFRENAEMAQAFWEASGILPIRKEFGRWVNDLRDFREAGITVQQMREAVAYMKQKNMPIGAPGSVFKIARSLASPQPRSSPAAIPKNESWTEIAARLAAETEETDLLGFNNMLPDGEVIDL